MSVSSISNSKVMVALTDYDWYSTLMGLQSVDMVNFWTPTPWNVSGLSKGDKVYFLLKEKYGRKICGYGDFAYYENESVEEAWNKYGIYNGVENLANLQLRVARYTDKNSEKGFTGQGHIIGCIILNDVVFFDQIEQVSPKEYGWDIPKQVVKYKYFDQQHSIASIEQSIEDIFPFILLSNDDAKEYTQTKSKNRKGQFEFRQKILKAYNNTCCITGEKTLDLLQAAHIQNHISQASNHIQNGILLRIAQQLEVVLLALLRKNLRFLGLHHRKCLFRSIKHVGQIHRVEGRNDVAHAHRVLYADIDRPQRVAFDGFGAGCKLIRRIDIQRQRAVRVLLQLFIPELSAQLIRVNGRADMVRCERIVGGCGGAHQHEDGAKQHCENLFHEGLLL